MKTKTPNNLKPTSLIKHRNTYYLPIILKNYTELAELQKGLLLLITQLRDTKTADNEGIYWIARILKSTIISDNYEILDQLNQEE